MAEKYLSPSRIKTFKNCSWLYWCNYVQRLPQKTNEGAARGTACHSVFESMGNPRHQKYYVEILKTKNVDSCPSVVRLLETHLRREGFLTEDNMKLCKKMVLNGLEYDFFCDKEANPSESFDEKSFRFEIDRGDIQFNLRGFIDKLFVFKKESKAIFRDFKTSSGTPKGSDYDDCIQDQIYHLALKYLYPDITDRTSEFLYLKFDLEKKGLVKHPLPSDEELEGLEYQLTEIQKIIDKIHSDHDFGYRYAKSNLAYDKGYPSDGSFTGMNLCARTKRPKELKKDGSPKWQCPYKWPFKYYVILDKEGKEKGKYFLDEAWKVEYNEEDGETVEIRQYEGCPAFAKRSRQLGLI